MHVYVLSVSRRDYRAVCLQSQSVTCDYVLLSLLHACYNQPLKDFTRGRYTAITFIIIHRYYLPPNMTRAIFIIITIIHHCFLPVVITFLLFISFMISYQSFAFRHILLTIYHYFDHTPNIYPSS